MSVGADNMNKIYGILLKPHYNKETFDDPATSSTSSTSSSHPVLVNSYAGPHDAYCPKAFSLVNFIQVLRLASLSLSLRNSNILLKKIKKIKKELLFTSHH